MSSVLLTQVEKTKNDHGARFMETARYFRDQAALCLKIAQQMSDPQAAEDLRVAAAQRFARAAELEKQTGSSGPRPTGTKE